MKYFKLSADKGNASGQFSLALAYYDGKITTQDYQVAFDLFKLSADQGHAEAMNYLGIMYNNGQGVPQDYSVAMEYFKKSIDAGGSYAIRNLALSLERMSLGFDTMPLRYALFSVAASKNIGDATLYKDNIAKKMTTKQISLGQELSRRMMLEGIVKIENEYIFNNIMDLANKSPKQSIHTKKVESQYPPKPAKRKGVTSCNTNCNNGDCYRTYDNGKHKHFQVAPTYNPLNSQWEYNAGSC